MTRYALKVPELILVKALSFALFIVNFNGPAMAANSGNACGLPAQAIADIKNGVVRQVSFAKVDYQALFAKFFDLCS
jgi:hypothetical protein